MTATRQAPAPVEQPDTEPNTLPASGRPPVAAPAAGYLGTLLALLVLAAGVVALREVAVLAGWLHSQLWIGVAIDWIDGLTFQQWMYPLGVVTALIGIGFVYAALRPRRHTAIPVEAETSVWMQPGDVARIASRISETVPGVLNAHATAGLHKINVKTETTAESDDAEIKTVVANAVRDKTNFLSPNVKVAVRNRVGGR